MFKEAYRVLKDESVLICNTSGHRQLEDGFWWAELIPSAVNKIKKRFPLLLQFTMKLPQED